MILNFKTALQIKFREKFSLCLSLGFQVYMKTTLESNSRLGLLICLLLVICNTESLVNHKQQHNVGFKVDKQITCPVCGLRSKDGIIGTSILRCEQFYAPHSRTLTNNGDSSRLPSFKCNCNYSYVNKRRCSSDDAILGPNTGQNKNVEGECLVAHVGMAIQGKDNHFLYLMIFISYKKRQF